MIVTEREAAEKWCPHVRLVIGPDNALWRDMAITTRLDDLKGPLSMCCIGSRCMAWRAGEPEIEYAEGSRFSTPSGYCGLAGKP